MLIINTEIQLQYQLFKRSCHDMRKLNYSNELDMSVIPDKIDLYLYLFYVYPG